MKVRKQKPCLAADVDLFNLADVETYVASSHRDLDHSSHYRPFSASPTAADSHSLAVSEPNAALLYSSLQNLELAPVAVVSPHRDPDHSSHSHPLPPSFSSADPHPQLAPKKSRARNQKKGQQGSFSIPWDPNHPEIMTMARFMRNPYTPVDPEAQDRIYASLLAAAQARTRAREGDDFAEPEPDPEPDVDADDDLDDRKSEDEDPPVAACEEEWIDCPHELVLSTALYGDDNSIGWNCDGQKCNSVYQTVPRMHCAACEIDFCLTCWDEMVCAVHSQQDDAGEQEDCDLEHDQDIDVDELDDADVFDEFGDVGEDEYGSYDDF